MSKFKKLPIEIEAVQWKGTPKSLTEIKKLGNNGDILYNPISNSLTIITLEGAMVAKIGDWIIEGIEKEIYPCKDTIFRETYCPSEKDPLNPAKAIVRNTINTDKSGLAKTINDMQKVFRGYQWIADREWGPYDHSQRNTETLQTEVKRLLDELETVSKNGLNESGKRVEEHRKRDFAELDKGKNTRMSQ